MPSGFNVRYSRIQTLSLFCLWFSFQLGLWSMIYILDQPKLSNECPGDTKCWLTGKSVFFVRSLLRPFILLLNGWTLSPTYYVEEVNHIRCFAINIAKDLIYSFPVVLLWNTCECCNWRQHLQRLSLHGLHCPTVDEGLDTAALTSVSLMLLGRRNATTGGSGNNLASVSPFSISFQWWRTISEIFSKEGW
jgi:hypothetical protein